MELARTVYRRDLKIAAMRAMDAGETGNQVARRLQLSPKPLERWRGEWRARGEAAFPGQGHRQAETPETDERRIAELERNFGTWQGRLPQELRLRDITTVEEANGFLREHYIAEFNQRFHVAASQRGTAFTRCTRRDLEQVFSLHYQRIVNRDNTVTVQNLSLQIERAQWRGTLAGCNVTVHQHLDGSWSISYGPNRLGQYTAAGVPMGNANMAARKAVEKTAAAPPWKTLYLVVSEVGT